MFMSVILLMTIVVTTSQAFAITAYGIVRRSGITTCMQGTHYLGNPCDGSFVVLLESNNVYLDMYLEQYVRVEGINEGVECVVINVQNIAVFQLPNCTPVSGCFDLKGYPGVHRKVILRQNLETDQVTYTDRQGCYSFDSVNHDKPFSVIIQSTWAPASSPVGLQAKSVARDKVNLKWQYSPQDAASFKVFRWKGASGTWGLLATTAGNTLTYSDTTALGNDLTNTYYYYVKACNSDGCSPAMETAALPFKATNLTAKGATGKISLVWTDNSDVETGFRIFRKDGTCSSSSPWHLIEDAAANTEVFDDTTVTGGQQYSYRVQAYFKSSAEPYAFGFALSSNCAGDSAP